jgi:P-type conjugative transfer protein TrbG
MKNSKWVAGLFAAAVSVPAFAQNVPALANGGGGGMEELPQVRMVSPDRVYLDPKEVHGLRLANEWKTNPDKPRRSADGSVKYLFGATLPTLVCTPLQVCSIQLQPGEVVNDVHAGDTARWRITPATSGAGDTATTFVIVKPTDAGLVTNLLITTDRRTYTIKLASTQKDWIPVLSFDYPDDVNRAWADYRAAQARHVNATTLPTGENLANLDFNFRIRGDNPRWRPQRVYTDGRKTYIQFASANFGGEAPALVALGSDGGLFSRPSEQLVNYRVIGDRYVVDKVLDRAALITGVGRDQVKVVIERGR